jgi:beta-lactam-binding protein with PASTA domain
VPGGGGRDESDRRTWIIAGIVALALLVIAALLFFLLRPTSTTQVTVPNVTGISSKAACDQLRHNNLKCKISSREASDTVQKGFVIDYTPKGAVDAGTTINLVVSTGKPTTAVPNVVCEDKATAEADLQAAGFQPLVAGRRPNAACSTPGLVGAQVPTSPNGETKAPQGSIVRIYLVPQPSPSPSPSASPTVSPSPSPSGSPTTSPSPSSSPS